MTSAEGKGLTTRATIPHAASMQKHATQFFLSVAVIWVIAGNATAQEWSNAQVSEMLVSELSPTGTMEGGKWFTSAQQLSRGVRALGIIYAHIPGSAGSVSIHAASFYWTGTGWQKYSDIADLFGSSPKNAIFNGDRVTLTTVTLGPNDPRCCPTREILWSIDLRTGVATSSN